MSLLKFEHDESSLDNVEDKFYSITSKTEISKLIVNLMWRLFPVSNNSETIKNDYDKLIEKSREVQIIFLISREVSLIETAQPLIKANYKTNKIGPFYANLQTLLNTLVNNDEIWIFRQYAAKFNSVLVFGDKNCRKSHVCYSIINF